MLNDLPRSLFRDEPCRHVHLQGLRTSVRLERCLRRFGHRLSERIHPNKQHVPVCGECNLYT